MALGGKLQEALAGSLRHGGGCSVAGKGARKAPDSGIAFAGNRLPRQAPQGTAHEVRRDEEDASVGSSSGAGDFLRTQDAAVSSWSFTNVLESEGSELGR